jgi:diguanylate cyclase (GGDEF)-like protein/PAS domain S-box-containing protein
MSTFRQSTELVRTATESAVQARAALVKRARDAAPLHLPGWAAYLIGVLALTAAYLVAHYLHVHWLNSGPVYNVIGGSAVVALVVGARRNTSHGRLPWYLFACGQALFVTGDILAYNYEKFFGTALPFPSVADAFYLAFYPLFVAGLLLLIRQRNETRNRACLVEALILTVGASTLSWVYLMAPYAHDHTLSLPTKLTSIAYPSMDILVLGVVLRLSVGGRRRGLAFKFLVSGTAMLLVSDVIYGWMLLHGGYTTGALLDAGWAIFYALLGAAALHPSMRQLGERSVEPDDRLTRYRLLALTCATLTAPVLLIVRHAMGESLDSYVLRATSIVLFTLVLVRMTGLVHRHEEAVRREAALRRVSEALVMAMSREEICSAALGAVASLVDTDVTANLFLTDPNGDLLIGAGARDGADAGVPPLSLSELRSVVGENSHQQRVVTVEEARESVSLAPLFIRDEIVGLFTIHSPARLSRAAEESLATLASGVALALQSAALSEQAHNQRSEARLSSLVEHASDVICIVGEDAAIHYLSPSVQRVFGYAPGALAEGRIVDIVHPEERQQAIAFIAAIAGRPAGLPQMAEFRMGQGAEAWRDVEVLGTNLLGNEAIEGVVLNIRDVTERNELNHRAFHDPLTNLPNRSLFRNRLEHALAGQVRDKLSVAVLFIDIDNFKDVNDTLGHAIGDKALQEVGRRLDACIRPVDTAARIGGDEFAVLIHGADSETYAIEIAHRVMDELTFSMATDDKQVTIAASIGIAFNADTGAGSRDAAGLLRDADAAMYKAKQYGKGCYQVFPAETHAQALTRLELKADLERAMDNAEFSLRYQPIIDLSRGDVAGVEALVRWEHPAHGTLAPADFIPIVEETGVIVPLGHRILQDACRHAELLQRECPRDPPLSISVNVSASQLQRAEFIDEVRGVLQETAIAPGSLILEVTESVTIQDVNLSTSRMNALRELGVRLAIDDFGTGYSSLKYLRSLPVDILKIDRSFLANPSRKVTLLTAAVVQLARIFDLKAVIEGIENEAHLELIEEMHADFGQGFHFSKPLPGEDVVAFIAKHTQATTSTATEAAGANGRVEAVGHAVSRLHD